MAGRKIVRKDRMEVTISKGSNLSIEFSEPIVLFLLPLLKTHDNKKQKEERKVYVRQGLK